MSTHVIAGCDIRDAINERPTTMPMSWWNKVVTVFVVDMDPDANLGHQHTWILVDRFSESYIQFSWDMPPHDSIEMMEIPT
jgi:hypothetical protein